MTYKIELLDKIQDMINSETDELVLMKLEYERQRPLNKNIIHNINQKLVELNQLQNELDSLKIS